LGNINYNIKTRKMRKTLLKVSLLFICIGITIAASAQNSSIEGKWTLKDVQIEKYTPSGESVIQTYDSSGKQDQEMGIFQELSFGKDNCTVLQNNKSENNSYSFENSVLKLHFNNTEYEYYVAKDNSSLTLTRTFIEDSLNKTTMGTQFKVTLSFF
jgi:hypothetical protein